MDGFLGVIRSALAAPATGEASTSEAAEGEASVDAQAAAAAQERRAKAQLEKRLAEMDKYELKRFQLEQQYKKGSSSAAGEDRQAGGTSGHEVQPAHVGHAADAQQQGRVAEKPENSSGVVAGARKRATEDKIAAARERAKQRKANR